MATRTTGPGSGGTGFVSSTAWTEAAIDKLPGGLAAYIADAGGSAVSTEATAAGRKRWRTAGGSDGVEATDQ